MLGDGPVRALQIFLRPKAPDLEPMVQFHEFPEESSVDSWRLIVGSPLTVRSDILVFDARISKGAQLRLPNAEAGRNILLYVYSGKVALRDEVISEGESVFTTAFISIRRHWRPPMSCCSRSIPKRRSTGAACSAGTRGGLFSLRRVDRATSKGPVWQRSR